MKNNLLFFLLTIVITASTGMHFYHRSPANDKAEIFDKILSGNISLTSNERLMFEDDSKVNAIYVELFDNVIELNPNLTQLKYLAASALVMEKNKMRKNNLRNLLLQLSFMNEFQRSKINEDYQILLKAIVKEHFPEILMELRKDNPEKMFFNF